MTKQQQLKSNVLVQLFNIQSTMYSLHIKAMSYTLTSFEELVSIQWTFELLYFIFLSISQLLSLFSCRLSFSFYVFTKSITLLVKNILVKRNAKPLALVRERFLKTSRNDQGLGSLSRALMTNGWNRLILVIIFPCHYFPCGLKPFS